MRLLRGTSKLDIVRYRQMLDKEPRPLHRTHLDELVLNVTMHTHI